MGSRAGCPNRNKEFLLKRLQDMYGDDFDPIIKMAYNCMTLQGIADKANQQTVEAQKDKDEDTSITIDIELLTSSAKNAIDGWDKVAQYVQPKLKAIELSSDQDHPLALEITYAGIKSSGKREPKKQEPKSDE